MQSFRFKQSIRIMASACTGGAMEKEGPLGHYLDISDETGKFEGETWEESESRMLKQTIERAIEKAGKTNQEIDYLFCGDLLRQMTASSFGVKSLQIPVFGVYGACSTMGESLVLASVLLEAEVGECVVAATSSHYATAEKEFRFPLSYGNQRPPCATWTVTGSGAAVLERGKKEQGIYVVAATPGKIVDYGITDKANMGACMAPAAADTICQHMRDFDRTPKDYDRIITGDLGVVGKQILLEFLEEKGMDIEGQHMDCGIEIFSPSTQDTHAGGSGCGCSAVTFCGKIMKDLQDKKINNVLFMATGALMNPTSSLQGESIPSIAHALRISNSGGHV